ncbi:DUF4395 domain-containing protein [Sulfurimonas sp. HSL-3221]|uniref:DUF4395 domain-containing protein n=1 Tax=Sulfurimonadaceae TaxID=2771471 RepID=UPI001E49D332|nr:DUF4395 domain-containing protein [Sulfurimonas sp. HSL-3221]UFS62729.1 DUF4395 domain-containing protein [Sulfurimonas sp. HSL-3221]
MAAACPVALIKIDENLVRLQAFLVVIAVAAFLWSGSFWLLALLVYDFAIRVLGAPKGSPFFLTSRAVVKRLPVSAKPVDAGPKKFAAKIGLVFVITALLLAVGGYVEAATWLMTVMALFALLEAACGFCVGCKLYTLCLPLFSRQ